MHGKFVAYYRVSTLKQDLGLDAQKHTVQQYLNGGDWQLIGEFEEKESGKDDKNRPKLHEALQACKRHKATLIIAKLDRLSRSVRFIAELQESKVKFVACDMPQADEFTINIIAALAQRERKLISQRTSEGMQAAKRRGQVFGDHGKVLAAENKAKSIEFAKLMAPVITDIRAQGFTSVRKICAELNARQIETAYGKGCWHVLTTHKLLQQIDAL